MADAPELKTFSVSSYDNNVYILVDQKSSQSVLIDAPDDAPRILQELRGTTLKYILMTHADMDHVQALEAVHEATGALIGIAPAEERHLPHLPDFTLHDGDVLNVGDMEITVLYTPGHTPGGTSFLVGNMLFGGDTLFPGGPGNTKRPISNFDHIMDSIRTRFFTLPDDTTVYPGHGKSTTIGAEKPHLQEWLDRGW